MRLTPPAETHSEWFRYNNCVIPMQCHVLSLAAIMTSVFEINTAYHAYVEVGVQDGRAEPPNKGVDYVAAL